MASHNQEEGRRNAAGISEREAGVGTTIGDWDEACWGSENLPLIPFRLSPILQSKKNRFGRLRDLTMSRFCGLGWGWACQHAPAREGLTRLQSALQMVEDAFRENERLLDIPIFDLLISVTEGAEHLPLQHKTWVAIDHLGRERSASISRLLSGTFLEVWEQLGSVEAMLDLVVTAQHWILERSPGIVRFRIPRVARDLDEAFELSRQRQSQYYGLSISPHFGKEKLRELLLRRDGLDIDGPWTLEACAQVVSVTRERFRQYGKEVLWRPTHRCWRRGSVDQQLMKALKFSSDPVVNFFDADGAMCFVNRKGAEALLNSIGYLEEEYQAMRISVSSVTKELFRASEQTGFLSWERALLALRELFPEESDQDLHEILKITTTHRNLYQNFVYVEKSDEDIFIRSITKVLSLNGPVPFEDLWEGWIRFCQFRRRDTSHISPAIVRSLLELDHRFSVDTLEIVLIVNPVEVRLEGAQGWIWRTVKEAPGCVIHEKEILDQCRVEGLNPTTIQLYCRFEPYIKMLQHGFVTLTGLFPSQSDIDQAKLRAEEHQIPTVIDAWNVHAESSTVSVTLGVGSSLANLGLWYPELQLIEAIGMEPYVITADDQAAGRSSWFGQSAAGWRQAMQLVGAVPGGTISIVFSLNSLEARVDRSD